MTGSQLRLLRIKAGVTQAELARRMGCSRSLVVRLEAEYDPIGMERAYDLAMALGLNPHDVDPRLVDKPPAECNGVCHPGAPMIRAALTREPNPPPTTEADDYSQDHPDD